MKSRNFRIIPLLIMRLLIYWQAFCQSNSIKSFVLKNKELYLEKNYPLMISHYFPGRNYIY